MATTQPINSDRLQLTPLRAADAAEMVEVLADQELYRFTGGEPPSLDQLHQLYHRQSAGSGRDDEIWHNWVIRLDGKAIGYVQATVKHTTADLAWVVGSSAQGFGYGTKAATAMRDWLASHQVQRFTAHIHPDHAASAAIAAKLGLEPTGEIDDDGEMIWASD